MAQSRLVILDDQSSLLACAAGAHTLIDPVLLCGCMHSVCRKCLQDLSRVPVSSNDHEVSAGIACPRCGIVGATARHKPNHFLLMLLRALGKSGDADALCDFCPAETKASADRWCAECSRCICTQCAVWHTKFNKDHATRAVPAKLGGGKEMAGGAVPCDMCAEAGKDVGSASCWCAECSKAMCARCTTWHDRFQKAHGTTSLQAGDAIINRSLLTAPACGQHDLQFEFFCKTCDSLKCADCSKPCLESNHHTWVVDGSRAREHIEKTKADIKAAHELLQSRSGSWMLATTDADEERDMLDRVERALAADQDRLSCNRRRAVDSLNKAFDEAEQQVQKHYETVRQRLVPEPRGTALTGQTLRDSLHHALLYCQVLLQAADAAVVLDQHVRLLASLQVLADQASRLMTPAAAEEELRPVVPSVDAEVAMRLTAALSALPAAAVQCGGQPVESSGGGSSDDRRAEVATDAPSDGCQHSLLGGTGPAEQLLPSNGACVEGGPATGDGNDHTQPANDSGSSHSGSRAGDKDCSGIVSCSSRPAVGLGAATCVLATEIGNFRDVALTSRGRVLLADTEKGLRQYDVNGKRLHTWRVRRSSSGRGQGDVALVSCVCALDDGRVAVGLIGRRRLVLLGQVPERGRGSGGSSSDGTWQECGKIKLRCEPYHVTSCGRMLAVAGARTERTEQGSKWTPGRQVDLATLGDARVVRSVELDYEVVAVLLTDATLVVASVDRQLVDGNRWRHIVDAYDREALMAAAEDDAGGVAAVARQRLWRHECDEHAHDLCTTTVASGKNVIYAALPDRGRVTAIDGRNGQWLADVLLCTQEPLLMPLRMAAACLDADAEGRASGSDGTTMTILYGGGTVAIYPVSGV